jgi:hypothetical protein
MDGQIVTGEIVDTSSDSVEAQVLEAMANAVGYVADNVQAKITGTPPKAKKPRKARATSKFVVLTAEYLKDIPSYPNLVAARKSVAGAGVYLVACLREEVTYESYEPKPVTKVTVKRVVR